MASRRSRATSTSSSANTCSGTCCPNAVDLIILAALAVFVQAISPHKFVGWGVMVALPDLAASCSATLGFEAQPLPLRRRPNRAAVGHERPGPVLDRRLVVPALLGRLRAACCWSLAYALWRRGTESRLAPRLRRLPHGCAARPGVILGVGARRFRRLRRLHLRQHQHPQPYRTELGDDRWTADYEKSLPALRDAAAAEDRLGQARRRYLIRTRPVVTTRASMCWRTAPARRRSPALHVRFDRRSGRSTR